MKGDYTYQQKNLSDDAKNLIKGLINLEPQKRLTVPQILVHPWLKETKDGDSSSDDEEAPEETKGEGKNDIGGKTSDIDLTNI